MLNARLSRRQLLQGVGAAASCAALSALPLSADVQRKSKLRLGVDNYAVRAMGWKADRLIGYANSLDCDTLFITDLDAFESFDDPYLKSVKQQAEESSIQLSVGTWSICPSAIRFKDKWGNADEHLALGIRVAEALGSPVIRVILGGREDRLAPGGIGLRIADTVRVLKRGRSRAMDAGVKIAVENHGGDLHSLELVRLIEEAGSEFVGANMDSGNAAMTLEDPLQNLANLGPYAIATSLRDAVVWETDRGATLQWTAMGEGQVDWGQYFELFTKLCPDTPVNIETISGRNFDVPFNTDDYQKGWPQGRPEGFDKYLAMVKRGQPRAERPQPDRAEQPAADQNYQRDEIERSIAFCRQLGLGLR